MHIATGYCAYGPLNAVILCAFAACCHLCPEGFLLCLKKQYLQVWSVYDIPGVQGLTLFK